MPIYSFRCRKCSAILELDLKMDQPRPTECGCGGELVRLYFAPNVHYRGSGFFTNEKKLTPVDPLDYNPDED